MIELAEFCEYLPDPLHPIWQFGKDELGKFHSLEYFGISLTWIKRMHNGTSSDDDDTEAYDVNSIQINFRL